MFSLEEEDGFMFVTQSDNIINEVSSSEGILGDPCDFASPVISALKHDVPQYSDISDDDCGFEFPLSQGKIPQHEAHFE